MKRLIILCIIIFLATTIFAEEKDVAITIYNNNLALVKDSRSIDLKKGINKIQYNDVAALIDPTSVHFKSLSHPNSVSILEQNYEYDLVNPEKILQKYIDKDINVFTDNDGPFRGSLLSSSHKYITLKTKSGNIKIISLNSVVNLDFPELPEGLITKPTLMWSLQNNKDGTHHTEVSYLTSGINWHAEYVAVTKKDDSILELSSWVSVDNKSGIDYENARLKVVAGDVHIVQKYSTPRSLMKTNGYALAEAAPPQFTQKSFFEYHLYTLQRKATINNNQIKQISLFPTSETKITKIYIYNGGNYGDDVRVNLEFKNSKSAGLGIPLPKGKVRVYKKDDADNSLEFVGEDIIDHTPKDEKVRIYLGNAFDIKGKRIKKSSKRLSNNAREETWQITLKNHKETDVTVFVVENLRGDWEILEKSHSYIKKDANTIEFEISLEKDNEVNIEYRVLLKW